MRLILPLVVLFLLSACGPTTPVYDQQALQQARTPEQMQALLNKMQTDLQHAKRQGGNTETLQQQIDRLRQRLAGALLSGYLQQAEQERTGSFVPLQRLQLGSQLLQRLENLDQAAHARLHNWLATEQEKTERAVAERRKALGATDALHLNQRMQHLQQLELLTGERQVMLEEDVQRQYVSAVTSQVEALMQAFRYPAANELLQAALQHLPGEKALQQLQQQVQAELLANAFEQALEDGQPEQAFAVLEQLQQKQALQQVQQRLETQIMALARYFAERGSSALKGENWPEAWASFQTARRVLQLANQPLDTLSTSTRQLQKALQNLSVRANQEGLPGLQLTYLLMLQQWLNAPEELESKIQLPRQDTLNQAIHRLSISPFRSTEAHQGLGAALAARLTAQLLQRIPHDVRVVERDELEAIIRERALDTRGKQRGMKIAPADFLVQGNILDATVEHGEKKSFQTERVQTGVQQRPNPEHEAWLADRKRKKKPEPPRTLEQPVFEDIRYAITLHKNTAVLSASYRLIDAGTAKILRTSTITRERTMTDISSEGVQLGSYNKPLKLADLPSDSEMLKELLLEVADAMSDELVQFLSHTEEEHLAKAHQQAERGNYAEAAELAARAWVVARAKGKDAGDIYREMVAYALQAGI